jgi:hypothetical protein
LESLWDEFSLAMLNGSSSNRLAAISARAGWNIRAGEASGYRRLSCDKH